MNPIKPFQEQGHYTEVHNLAFDYIMPRVSSSAWKVLSLIIRRTKGWGKKFDEIPYAQIKEGTGIKSDPTVDKALKQLRQMGCILSKKGATQFESTKYMLNRNFTIEDMYSPGEPTPEGPPTIENVADESTTENKAATIENVAVATTEIKAATAIETKETQRNKTNEANCKGVRAGNTRPPTRPMPERRDCVLQPPPDEADDTIALAVICNVNLRHPDERDVKAWPRAIETVRAAMTGATPEQRAAAIFEFDRRWKAEGRSSPYLTQVNNNWSRVMSDDPIEAKHGKSHKNRLENSAGSAIQRAEERGRHRVEQLENLTDQRAAIERRRAELEARRREMDVARAA
jgi:hypothetical protein